MFAQIAGGSGVTPMLQVASEVLRNPDDETEVSLIFGNVRSLFQIDPGFVTIKMYLFAGIMLMAA